MSKRGPLQDEKLNQRIGFRIFKERERRGLTILVLAKRAGMHRNTICRAERGFGISVCALVRIAAAMDLGLDELLAFAQTIVHYGKVDALPEQKAATVVFGTSQSLFANQNASPGSPADAAQRPKASKSEGRLSYKTSARPSDSTAFHSRYICVCNEGCNEGGSA